MVPIPWGRKPEMNWPWVFARGTCQRVMICSTDTARNPLHASLRKAAASIRTGTGWLKMVSSTTARSCASAIW